MFDGKFATNRTPIRRIGSACFTRRIATSRTPSAARIWSCSIRARSKAAATGAATSSARRTRSRRNGNLNTLEGDPRFYLDDSLSPQGQGTGSEEWGGGGDYWGGERMTLPFVGHPVGRPVGQMKLPIDKIHSAYRFLLSDLIPFGRNARFTLEHGGANESDEHY